MYPSPHRQKRCGSKSVKILKKTLNFQIVSEQLMGTTWDTSTCIGKPSNFGSLYYNYKNSLLLLASCTSDYCFSFVDIRGYGKESDSNIFKNTAFFKKLQNNTLEIPVNQNVCLIRVKLSLIFLLLMKRFLYPNTYYVQTVAMF